MRQWRKVAEKWLVGEGAQFPIIEVEIRKMLLASAKTESGNTADKREKAEQLLQTSGLSPNEWLAGAKELVRSSLWEGRDIDIGHLVATAEAKFDHDFSPTVAHSLALSCINAKRHDLARPLLQGNVQSVAKIEAIWGKSAWALARMESQLGDHSTAAGLYRQVFEESSVATQFRLQAQLLWCQELIAAGQMDSLLEVRSLMTATMGAVRDPDVLMNFARQLRFGPDELEEWSEEIFSKGESLALERFCQETNPSIAIAILFKLTRRQVRDFGRYKEVIALWEGFSQEKRDWLWSTKSDFWEYLGQVFEAYAILGKWPEAEAFAQGFIDDPASPSEGLPPLGIPFARRLMQENRGDEGLELYGWLARLSPNHRLCAEAWYWLALDAYQRGNKDRAKDHAARIRAVQGTRVGLFDEWSLDARAFLLLADLDPTQLDPQAVNYTPDYLQVQLQAITSDLKRIPT